MNEELNLENVNVGMSANTTYEQNDVIKEYKPPRSEMLQRHKIEIEFCSTGCIIVVGCKKIPFSSIEKGMKELNEYLTNPYEATQKWQKICNENN